ncbi:MAG: MFS transporter [Actinomycetes bacterium]
MVGTGKTGTGKTRRRRPLPVEIRPVIRFAGLVVLVDTMFFAVLSPLLASYATSANLDRAGIGLLVAAYPLGMVMGAIPAGALSSRWGPRKLLIVGLTATAIVSLLFTASSSGPMLVLFRFLQGAAGASSWTAAMSWGASIAPADRRGEVAGRLLGLSVAGSIAGPVVGALASIIGAAVVFSAVAALLLGVAVVAARQPAPVRRQSSGWAGALGLLNDPNVRIGLWLITLGGLTIGVINSQAPIELKELGVAALGTSAVYLVMAAFGTAGSPWAGKQADRYGRGKVATALLIVACATMAGIGLTHQVYLVIVLLIIAGTALEAIYIPASALLWDGTAAADTEGGEILAMANMLWASGMAIASVFAGVMSNVLGTASPYLVVAFLAAASIPFGVRIMRTERAGALSPPA